MSIRDELAERDNLIEFLREQYVIATGKDISLPYKWERFAGPPVGLTENIETTLKQPGFDDAVRELELPKALKEEKGKPKRKAESSNPAHQVQKINLSGYSGRKLTRESFALFSAGVKRLSQIKTIELSGNALNDTYIPELGK